MSEQARPKLRSFKASKSNVVRQAKLLDSAGTAWHAVKYGNLEVITKLFPSQCNVYAKGPVGENVLHIAMLLNTPSTLAIAKYLVKLYGKTLVNTPYQERKHEDDPPGQYEGETALHIAIVNHDSDMVKFLVQNGADVRARAYGSFFHQGGTVYYGEYPLSFAACTGQREIVSYLRRHGAHVNTDRDTWQNTALHMCVYHDQVDIYDHLVEFCGASENVRNNRGQTPLLLAASLGKVEMFQHIYNKRRKVAWAYGPVTSYSLSLHEIDSSRDSKGIPEPSAMEIMVRKGHMNILTDPLVKTLVTTKWERFARLHFWGQGLFSLAFVVLQTFLVWLHSSGTLWNTASRMALEIVCVCMACALMLLEFLDIHQWTVRVHRRRLFVRATEAYKPPLYPIPGETADVPAKEKSHFGILSRIMGGLSTHHTPGPVAEGFEQTAGHSTGSPPQESPEPQQGASTGAGAVPDQGAGASAGEWTCTGAGAGSAWSAGAIGWATAPTAAFDQAPIASTTAGYYSTTGVSAWLQGRSDTVAQGVQEQPSNSSRQPEGGYLQDSTSSLQLGRSDLAAPNANHQDWQIGNTAGLSAAVTDSLSIDRNTDGRHVIDWTGGASTAHPSPTLQPPLGPQGHQSSWPCTPHLGPGGCGGEGRWRHPGPTRAAAVCEGREDLPTLTPYTLLPPPPQRTHSEHQPLAEGGPPIGQSSSMPNLMHTLGAAGVPGRFPAPVPGNGPQWQPPTYAATNATGPLSVDIVSVGLPISGGGGLSGFSPTFTQPVTTMLLHRPTNAGGSAGPDAGGVAAQDQIEGRRRINNPSLTGSAGEIGVRDNSEVASEAGEFRNRRRGGAAEDLRTLRPSLTKRRMLAAASGNDIGILGNHPQGRDGASAATDLLKTLRHALSGYYRRQLQDPITLVMLLHRMLTAVHFVTWASTYGGVGGSGPSQLRVQEFDDVILSLVLLLGWGGLLYYARGLEATGRLQVMLELCLGQLLMFACFFVLADLGFTLAFYTLLHGTTSILVTTPVSGPDTSKFIVADPFYNIGYGMVQVLRFLYGEAQYDVYSASPYQVKVVFATFYFAAYVFMVVLLLSNLFIAMVVHTYQRDYNRAEMIWRLRWTSFILRTECRMPASAAQRHRLGEVSYDSHLKLRVYNHVFEVVDDGSSAAEDMSAEAQVRALEAVVDRLKKGSKKL